jgi:periplasmic mercuric ion binding protein
MKKLSWLLLITLGLVFSAFAQSTQTPAQTQTKLVTKGGIQIATIPTPTVQCAECKKRIENYVSREEGVQKVVVDYKKKTTTVTYAMERTNIENVKTAIANAGYDADDVKAEPDAYNKLPLCCKKPEDGGGHAK